MKKANKKIVRQKYGKFKFEVGQKIFYIGTLFEMYSQCEAEIISRSTSKSKIWYRVIFADGKKLQFVEHMIRGGEEEKGEVQNEN